MHHSNGKNRRLENIKQGWGRRSDGWGSAPRYANAASSNASLGLFEHRYPWYVNDTGHVRGFDGTYRSRSRTEPEATRSIKYPPNGG